MHSASQLLQLDDVGKSGIAKGRWIDATSQDPGCAIAQNYFIRLGAKVANCITIFRESSKPLGRVALRRRTLVTGVV